MKSSTSTSCPKPNSKTRCPPGTRRVDACATRRAMKSRPLGAAEQRDRRLVLADFALRRGRSYSRMYGGFATIQIERAIDAVQQVGADHLHSIRDAVPRSVCVLRSRPRRLKCPWRAPAPTDARARAPRRCIRSRSRRRRSSAGRCPSDTTPGRLRPAALFRAEGSGRQGPPRTATPRTPARRRCRRAARGRRAWRRAPRSGARSRPAQSHWRT